MIGSELFAGSEDFKRARFGCTTNYVPSATGWTVCTINAIYGNYIDGMSLSSNQMSVPAGRYLVELANGPSRTNVYFFNLYDVDGAAYISITPNGGTTNYEPYFCQRNDSGDGIGRDQGLQFYNLEIADTTIMELRVYCQTRDATWTRIGQTQTSNGLGCAFFLDWVRLGDYEDYS